MCESIIICKEPMVLSKKSVRSHTFIVSTMHMLNRGSAVFCPVIIAHAMMCRMLLASSCPPPPADCHHKVGTNGYDSSLCNDCQRKLCVIFLIANFFRILICSLFPLLQSKSTKEYLLMADSLVDFGAILVLFINYFSP